MRGSGMPLLKYLPHLLTIGPVLWLLSMIDYGAGASLSPLEQLQDLLPVWEQYRDTMYVAFAVLFAVLGIYQVASGRREPQQAVGGILPLLILAVVGLTFSYGIAEAIVQLFW